MAIDLTPEQRTQGEANFKQAAQAVEGHVNRRGFMKSSVIGGAAVALGAGGAYFGYQKLKGSPVRAALIGAGDEGGVLVGEHNKEYLQFVAVSDVRPSNMTRIFEGEPRGLRLGFKRIYGKNCDQPGNSNYIKSYVDWRDVLKDKDVEAVVIALPLHLHAIVAIECMRAGKHVLCEKLMAWNVKQCKQMIRVAKETNRILSIGHQRHYSMLYDHAQEVLKAGVLGDVKHIRALWHRNFSWPYVAPAGLKQEPEAIAPHPKIRDGWFQPVTEQDYRGLSDRAKERNVSLEVLMRDYGFKSVPELIRWRLHAETGGGLMAELGSHQLDAASIFLGKVKPLTVQGFGGKLFFGPGRNDRNIDDHVFVTYTFPGKNHPAGPNKGTDKDDVVVVTYSSVSTNSFEQYGECLMGTRGTMIVEAEQKVMLFAEKNPTAPGDQRTMEVSVAAKKSGEAAADATSTWGGPAPVSGGGAAGGPSAAQAAVSRGYREEMEDFAYCVREWDEKVGYRKGRDTKYLQRLPRCHGEVAMADAIIALGANAAMALAKKAMDEGQGNTVIKFEPEWFDGDSGKVPAWDGKEREEIRVKDVSLPS